MVLVVGGSAYGGVIVTIGDVCSSMFSVDIEIYNSGRGLVGGQNRWRLPELMELEGGL